MPTMLERLEELSDKMEKIEAQMATKDKDLSKAIGKTFKIAEDIQKTTASIEKGWKRFLAKCTPPQAKHIKACTDAIGKLAAERKAVGDALTKLRAAETKEKQLEAEVEAMRRQIKRLSKLYRDTIKAMQRHRNLPDSFYKPPTRVPSLYRVPAP